MAIIKSSNDIQKVRERRYVAMINSTFKNVDKKSIKNILEVGSGQGQMTIPLVKKFKRPLTALDSYKGAYNIKDMESLKNKLRKLGYEKLVKVMQGDATNMKNISNETFDLVISNEMLCDLKLSDIRKLLKGCFRVLKSNGKMVHSFLSPFAKNKSQKLLLRAESKKYSCGPVYWWKSKDIVPIIKNGGFKKIKVRLFDLGIKYDFKTSIEQLKSWKTNKTFIKKYKNELKKYRLSLPQMYIIYAEKI